MGDVLYRVEEVAKRLGIARSRVYELIEDGRLLSVAIGKSRRVPASAVNSFIAALITTAEANEAQRKLTHPPVR